MAASYRMPVLPGTAELIAELSPEKFATLKGFVREKYGVVVPKESEGEVIEALGLGDKKELRKLLVFLKFVYDTSADESDEDVSKRIFSLVEDFSAFAFGKKPSAESLQLTADRLVELLVSNDHVDIQAKRERISTGIVQSVTDFRAFIDLRPNIDRSRTTIREFVPIILFEIKHTNGDGEEENSIVQMTERDLEMLKRCIEDTEKKLGLVRTHPTLRNILSPVKA